MEIMRLPSGVKAKADMRTMGNPWLAEGDTGPGLGGRVFLPGRLCRQAVWVAAGHIGVLLLFFFGLNSLLGPAQGALTGALVALAVLCLVHGLLWRHLPENHPPDTTGVAPHLGTANHITLLRGLLISLTAGFLLFDPQGGQTVATWLPGGLYLAAAVLDGVDGAWARRTRTRTSLGEALDVRYDALGVLVASTVAVGTHRLPDYYLAAGGAYYVFQLFLRFRRFRGKPVFPAGARTFARLVAGFQMGFLGIALLPVFTARVLAVAAPVFLMPLLAGFVWDWLVMTGRIGGTPVRRRERPRHFTAGMTTKDIGISRTPIEHITFRRAPGQILALAAVAGLLYWTWRDVPLTAVVTAIGRWDWMQWVLFAGLNVFILAAMCWRWSFILRRMGHPVGFAALIGYRMGANSLSYITPGPQFGGEPFQVHCLTARHRVPAGAATASVAVDRLVELMGNLLFLSLAGLFGLPALLPESDTLLPVTAAMLGAVLTIGVLLTILSDGGRPFSRIAGKAAAWVGRPKSLAGVVAFFQAGEEEAARILTDRFRGCYVLGGLLQWSGFLAELWLIYTFLGMTLSVPALLTVAVAARLAFLLPLPGGLGALEAGQMLAVISLGGDPALAAAACGIMRARDLVLISSGGLLVVRWLRPPKERRPQRSPAPL